MLTFTLNNIGGVTSGSQAEMGFLRAAALWSSSLGDSVNIRLNVGFSSLGSSIIGQTSSSTAVVSYAAVKSALIADQSSANDATAVSNLAAGSSLSFFTNNTSGARIFDNDGSGNNAYLSVKTANLKALGIAVDANGQPVGNGVDASITFNSDFNFDFDSSNGISFGAFDFVSVAFHEIGHALGFSSGVDIVDYYSGSGPEDLDLNPYAVFSVLDLFRYSASGVRDLSFGGATYFSINGGLTNLGLFSTGSYNGDGRQASHWKDNLGLGIMDPTLGFGEAGVFTSLDLMAMDILGWNLAGTAPSGGYTVWGSGVLPQDKIGDFNGDGRNDIIQLYDGNNKAYVWLSNGSSFNPYAAWGSGVTSSDKIADFNGDGRDDIIQLSSNGKAYVWLSNGSSFNPYTVWGTGVTPSDKIGDFNGDGRDDIIQLYDGNNKAYVWLSNGSSFNPYTVWGSGVTSSDKIADFNGDGRDDIVQLAQNGKAYVWLSNGTSFNPYTVWGTGITPSDKTGDFNGDGRDDIIQLGSNGKAYVWLSNGSSFNPYTVWGSGVTSSDKIGDFNGDGRDDIIQLSSNGKAYVWLSNGTSFNPYTVWGTGVTPSDKIGDFNGDGRDDIIQLGSNGKAYVWLSKGTSFGSTIMVDDAAADNVESSVLADPVNSTAEVVVEATNAGIIGDSGNDTIAGDNYANAPSVGIGNDTLNGGGNDRLEGGVGDDALNGNAGGDTFVFRPGFGKDTIEQFGDCNGNQDLIEFSTSLFSSFSAVQAAMTQQSADVVIAVDASNQITLKGVNLSALDSTDFRFVA